MTTPTERLAVIYDSFKLAYSRRGEDLKAAASEEQANKILANVESLEKSYLDAAKHSLDATGDDVEKACIAASHAHAECKSAYASAQALAERIRLVARSATSVASLVSKASGKG